MKRTSTVLALGAAILLLLPMTSSTGQDPGAKGGGGRKSGPSGSGIRAVVVQLEGERTEVTDIQFKEEKLGIISLTQVPTDRYSLLKGKAKVTVPLTDIARIAFDGQIVRIWGRDGKTVEGEVDKQRPYFLIGKVAFGEYEVNLFEVKTVEFIHPERRISRCEACNRLYENPEWRFCPHDGAKLKPAK